MPSQRTDHCTPPVVADGIVYPVLGDPVDLDPCSNEDSIIRARRKIMLPEDGLSIPWQGKVYVNPPYGDPEIVSWVRKCAVDSRTRGAEIIALLPAHVSASWFDVVTSTARACFLWGPGIGNRRLTFGGNVQAATFSSAIVYWGPHLDKFTRSALRYCHPWYPELDLRYARALAGDKQTPEAVETLFAVADELLTMARHDDLAAALTSLGSATLGEILDLGDTVLLRRLRDVCAYELGAALLYAARSSRPAWLDHRLIKPPERQDPRQVQIPGLEAVDEEQAPKIDKGLDKTFDEQVYDAVARGSVTREPLCAKQLKEVLACSQGELRGALTRLRRERKITKKGNTQGAKYEIRSTEEEGQEDEARNEDP